MLRFLGRLVVGAAGFLLTCITVGLLVTMGIIYHFSRDLPNYNELANYNPNIVTRLYAGDGKLLAEYAVEKRVYVPLNAVPKRVTEAFVSAEDKDFYTNNGIDIHGIGRALRRNIHNALSNSHSLSGGSTITQQVVKNFLLTPEKSITRKIKEAILAFRITQIYTKDRILELYLNEIYLGRGSYGIAAAAINYFNKSLDELTLEEAAFLAALPQAPARSDPLQHYDRAKERRDYVINRMMDDHYITPDEARTAIATPITLHVRDATEMAHADFFAEEVRRELAAKYGNDALYKGGLFVKTTLDPQLQKYADEGLRYALTEYDRRKGYRGPLTHMDVSSEWQKQLVALAAKRRWPLFDEEQLGLVLESGAKKAIVGFTDGKKAMLDKEALTFTAHRGLSVGDVVLVAPSAEKDKTLYTVHQIPLVNGAMIVMDPHTGRVLAMSGGYAYGGTEFNRATQAHRQPGSAFKPFVYLTAMENNFTPATIVVDEPVSLSQGNGMPMWQPGNYHGDYLGPVTLRTGLEKSRNAMTVKLAQLLGLPKIIEVAERFGIYDKLPEQYSMVLGAQETTLIRLANAYAILDNGGKKVSPWLIERIDDRNGRTIARRDARDCTPCKLDNNATKVSAIPPLPADNRAQIVDPQSDYQVVSMLQGVIERGTGMKARSLGRPLAGKTGTTNDSRDTWFIGFSPDLVAGIYVGYDQPQTLGKKETGASVALPGFIRFMEQALKDKPSTPFRIPTGIQFVKIDQKTGQLPVPGVTDKIIMEAFKQGQDPGAQPLLPVTDPLATYQPVAPGTLPVYSFPSENEPANGVPYPKPDDLGPDTDNSNTRDYLPPSRYDHHGDRNTDQGTGGLY